MHTISLHNNLVFYSEPGDTLIEAAGRANIVLPHSCRIGRCCSCKCKVLAGTCTSTIEELGLSEQEKADGWILSCVRSATTDLVLDLEALGEFIMPPEKTLPCRINSLKRLAPDVLKIVLRLPPSCDFSFFPGQCIQVIGQDGARRSYSLANSSAAEKLLELHIRAVPGGAMSGYWFGKAKVNDLLRLKGPIGTFFLRDVTGLDLVFLATGTGIAPVKAMLESVAGLPEKSWPHSISVYWGGRTLDDLYLNLSSVGKKHVYVPVLSRPDCDWSGERGYVQHALIASKPNLTKTVIYACGSDAMIREAQDALVKAGLAKQRFFSDAFVCSGTD